MTLAVPLLAVVIAQRLWELAVSRSRLRQEARAGRAAVIPEPTYPFMVAVHAGWLAGCAFEPFLTNPQLHPWQTAAALAAWGVSLALRVWLLAALGGLWNVRLVRRAEQPIVTTGPYRFIRHPNYLAVILEIAAVPLAIGAYGTAVAATLANALVLWRRIAGEEAYLFSVPGYREAFAGKKRLIPGVF